MPTQRLLLLGTLVLVLGGCAIWYMKMILPEATTIDETVAVTVPTNLPNMDGETAGMADDATKTTAPTTAPAAPAPAATAPAVSGSIDSDVAAISDAADAPYDDSSLDSQFTSEGAAAITADYDL